MKNFIKIQNHRIRKSSIKEYKPMANNSIIIYFSNSRYKIESIVFKFSSEDEVNENLELLDNQL